MSKQSTYEHSLMLAREIRRYWMSRGYAIEVKVETAGKFGSEFVFEITSNIGPYGYPPKVAA